MTRKKTALSALLILAGAALLVPVPAAAEGTTMKFGMDAYSISAQKAAGVKPDYATLWVGPWNLDNWGSFDRQLDSMKANGVTPAIHFYYWGDDISASCIEKGCWSSLHDTHKNQAGWQKLAEQMVGRLHAKMGGATVVVIMESEFNKGNVATYEYLDGLLAAKADYIDGAYPASKIVLGLGNWNSGAWGTWDRAAAASDYIGLQGMRGSTRDSLSYYQGAYEATLSGAKTAQAKFGKPVFITDIALSSYPDSSYLTHQSSELKQFFTGIGALEGAGVKAIVYRSWRNADNMDTANYYGQAERHWGLAYSSGDVKSAGKVWIAGVKAERGAAATTSTDGAYDAKFTVSGSVNTYWADVKVTSSPAPAKVEMKVNGGSWMAMSKSSWGTWTKSTHVAKGSDVVFRATDSSGRTDLSGTYDWMVSSSPTTGTAFDATFTPKAVGNDWWVETSVKGTSTVTKVEAKVNGGSWTSLPKTSYGTWAKSIHAPNGAQVQFRATSSAGTDTSSTYTWT
jgi:hypothetical protein